MVRLSRGSTRWSGVIIDAGGLILTTGRNLGAAPVADFTTVGGATGQAWVIGRDDTKDVALLQVINPSQTYPALSLATRTTVQINEELASLAFTNAPIAALDKRNSRVVGVRQDLNTGVSYIQVQAVAQAGAEGGVVVDSQGRVRGLRMTETQMVRLGLGRAGEVYVMAAGPLSSIIVPQLQTGFTSILPSDTVIVGNDPGSPPPIPATISGTVTVGGQKPATAIRLYAKVSKAGLPDLWFSREVRPEDDGAYAVAIGITVSGYVGATVQFWTNAQQAPQTALYTPGLFQSIDLVFP